MSVTFQPVVEERLNRAKAIFALLEKMADGFTNSRSPENQRDVWAWSQIGTLCFEGYRAIDAAEAAIEAASLRTAAPLVDEAQS